jgi:hypothetical protein
MKIITLLIGIGLSSTVFAQFNPNDSLVAYFPFNGNANDTSGNGYNATVYGAVPTFDRFGNPNSAYEFDGVDDYINTFTSFDLQKRTVSFWAKPNIINGTGINSCGAIWQDNYDDDYGVILVNFRDNAVQLNGGGTTSYVEPNITANDWMHIALVRTTDSTKYYINNVLVGTGVAGDVNSITDPYDYLVIGTDRNRDRRFFNGSIDDIRIYNRALSTSEIDSLYNESNPILNTLEIQLDLNPVHIYPNPAKEIIHISYDGDILGLRLFNSQGKLVVNDQNTKNLSISKLTKGIYFLVIDTKRGVSKKEKIVID